MMTMTVMKDLNVSNNKMAVSIYVVGVSEVKELLEFRAVGPTYFAGRPRTM